MDGKPTNGSQAPSPVAGSQLTMAISEHAAEPGRDLETFYEQCLHFNASSGWIAS